MADRPKGTLVDWLQFSALVLAGLFAGWKIWYDDYYRPRNDQPAIDLRYEMTKLPARGGFVPIALKATVHNKTRYRATVMSSLFIARGQSIRNTVAPPPATNKEPTSAYLTQLSYAPEVVVASGRLWDAGSWFEPGQVSEIRTLIFVLEGKFDLINSNARLRTARDTTRFKVKWTYKRGAGWQDDRLVRVKNEWEPYDPGKHVAIREKEGARTFETSDAVSLW